ncbi:MAG: 4'-phosphopantetheinyl transferase family protein [Chthoniobacterales bacterium]
MHLSEAEEFRALLSEEEKVRAEQISNPALRKRFVIGRGMRRKMLSEAAGLPIDQLVFAESADGKPRCANVSGWDFNVSHSGDYVFVAVGRGRVGVDLEQIRPVREMESIVERYFHRDEAVAWRSLDTSLREEAFFVLWSAREAAMKCVGLGLARGLSITRVDPAIVTEDATSARVGGVVVEVRRLSAPRGYVAAVGQAAA